MAMDAGLDNTGQDRDAWEDARPRGTSDAAPGRTGAELPDPHQLAQDWITLWQSELTAMAADPEIQESWQTIMALWAGSMATLLRGLPRAETRYNRHDRAARQSGTADATGPSAAAAAPDARDAEIERLARHVAALERRLAELERGGGERGGDPGVHPRVGRKPASGRRKQRK